MAEVEKAMAEVEKAPAGVERAGHLERLYRDQGARMWRAVLAFAGDPEVASESVAETFAQALRRGDEIRDPEHWIWRTLFRVAGGLLRERSRSLPFDVERSYEMEEPARELVAALHRLSPKQRASLVLHYEGGYAVKEIAAMLSSTPGAVKVHLLRGRRRLRELLEEDDA
jgi:RNA polymerase sigma-70 factor (ECF subfamily)